MKEFSSIICFSIVIFGIFEMLSPNENSSKIFKRLISVILIILLFSSISSLVKNSDNFKIDFSESYIEPSATDIYNKEVIKQAEKNIKNQIINTLEYNDYDYSEVLVDIEFSNYQASINSATVYIKEFNFVKAEKIKSLLYEKFNINIIVKEA